MGFEFNLQKLKTFLYKAQKKGSYFLKVNKNPTNEDTWKNLFLLNKLRTITAIVIQEILKIISLKWRLPMSTEF